MGKHAFKFGGELHRNDVNGGAFGNARGSITFLGGVLALTSRLTALEDFFAGDPFKATVQVGNPTLQIHNWAYGLFFQDDWRVTRTLTINSACAMNSVRWSRKLTICWATSILIATA